MGFKLKTNNRKVESGTVVTAKIVSPDKLSYDYQDFAIIVQPQSLSDKEKVIRDAQAIAAILDGNNPDWTRITNKINGVVEASKAATYCDVYYGDITSNGASTLIDNGEDQNHNRIVNINNGEVIKRPAYSESASQSSTGFTATLQMSVKSGDEVEVIRRIFIVPMYTKEEVLAIISEYWTENKIWDIIKNTNTSKDLIHAGLTVPTALNVLTTLGLNSIIDTSNDSNIPSLQFTFPSYTINDTLTPMISANGEFTTLTASEAWQLDRGLYNVNGLKAQNVSSLSASELTSLGINVSKSKQEIALYSFCSKTASQNKITTKWSYDNGETSITTDITNICFLSEKVNIDDIRDNVASSFSLGWFIPAEALASYGITDELIGSGNSEQNRKRITIPTGKHVLFRLANSFNTLVSSDSNPVTDKKKIGYYIDNANNSFAGFNIAMFSDIEMSFSVPMHVSTDYVSVDDSNSASTDAPTAQSVTGSGSVKSVYLNTSEAQPLTGSIVLTFKENSLGITGTIPVYFSVSIGS